MVSEGRTREEALKNIKEAITGYLESFPDNQELIKKNREVDKITI